MIHEQIETNSFSLRTHGTWHMQLLGWIHVNLKKPNNQEEPLGFEKEFYSNE